MVSVAFGCVYVFGVHCCRSQNILPRTTSTRVFVVSLWLYAVILTIAYSTNLTAFLIVSASPGGIETISDLYQSGKEVAGTGYFYKDALASSGDPYLQGLTERYRGYSTTDDILRKVVSGRAVYLQNRGSLEYVAATKFGNLALPGVRIMKECFAPYSIALAVQKHSPLKKNIDVVIGRLQNSGLIRQYFLQSLRRATASQELEEPDRSSTGSLDGRESAEGVTPLTLDHLQGVFLLMAFGWCLSGLSFIVESLL